MHEEKAESTDKMPYSQAQSLYEKIFQDCFKSCSFDSYELLSPLSKKAFIMGIDEAGRGPVLGPMVYASAIAPTDFSEKLKDLGHTDSKLLSEKQREQILAKTLELSDSVAYRVHIISAHEISTSMLSKCKTSLNVISHNAASGLIQAALDYGLNLKEVYIDTVGKAENYKDKLLKIFPNLDITVTSKADLIYPIVSAASIFAKVTRDRALSCWPISDRWKDTPLGSGYPGDPVTKQYLLECVDRVFGFPQIVRSSWSTASNLIEQHCISVEWSDDENLDGNKPESKKASRLQLASKGTTSLTAFFNPASCMDKKEVIDRPANPFRKAACLFPVADLV